MKTVYETFGPQGYGSYWITWGPEPLYERVEKSPDLLLMPGLIDLHCHGGFGIDWMASGAEGPSKCRQDLVWLADAFEKRGIEGFLPTSVTASPTDVAKALEGLPLDDPRILGFHLEGPFLSPKFPGAQPQDWIVDPPEGPSDWDPLLDHPALRVVTLAPERPRALDLILRLQKRGVRVSLGHTDATFEEMRRGFEFGATQVTHTYNAMRGLHHREAGAVGYVLSQPDLMCELIYDRVHVCKESAKILIQSRSERQILGVSDASAAAGLTPGASLQLWGHDVEIDATSVRLWDGSLAGSKATLDQVFRNWADDFGRESAIWACSLNPRRALGLQSSPRMLLEMNLQLDLIGIRSSAANLS